MFRHSRFQWKIECPSLGWAPSSDWSYAMSAMTSFLRDQSTFARCDVLKWRISFRTPVAEAFYTCWDQSE